MVACPQGAAQAAEEVQVMIEDLALAGIAIVLSVALTIFICLVQRARHRKPPLTTEEKIRRLESTLAETDKEIEGLRLWVLSSCSRSS